MTKMTTTPTRARLREDLHHPERRDLLHAAQRLGVDEGVDLHARRR